MALPRIFDAGDIGGTQILSHFRRYKFPRPGHHVEGANTNKNFPQPEDTFYRLWGINETQPEESPFHHGLLGCAF